MAALTVGVAWCGPAVASTGTAATGSIQTVSGANLVDGETFTISDGTHAPTVFEFDSDTSVSGANIRVSFNVGDTAVTIKGKILTAIDGIGASLNVTASSGNPALVALINDNVSSAGNVPITETVTDPAFTVSGMSGGDAAPVLATIGDKTVDAGAQLQFTVAATDPDGDALTYSAPFLPPGASFDPSSRQFSWTPTTAQVGTYFGLRFQVSDGTLNDFKDIKITVASTQQPQPQPQPQQQQPQSPPAGGPTGQRSAALEKCLKKKTKKARKKCGKRALALPL
jgi:Putative Ig domain